MSKQPSASEGAPSGAPKGKPRRKRRWLRRIGLTALTLVVLLGSVYVFRQQLFGRWVADEVGASLSEALGVPVRVERVLGSWVMDARVEQIAVDTDEALGVLAGFDADALQVHFSLWEVLFGDVIEGIHQVKAENLRLTLDFTRDAGAGDPVLLEEIVAAVPRRFPPIDIDAQITAIVRGGSIEVDDVAITSSGDDVMRFDASQIVLPRPAGLAGALHARIRRTQDGLQWQSDSVVAGLTLRELTAGEDGAIHASGRAAGADFALRIGKEDASLTTGTMRVEDVPPWVLRLLPASVFRPTSGTMKLTAQATSLDPLRLEAQLHGDSIDFPDEHIRLLRAHATIEPNRVTFTDTQVQARDGMLRATDLVFDTTGAWTVRSLERVDVSIQNIQSWVEFERPLGIELHADSADASRVNVRELKLEGAGTSLVGTGRIAVPDDLEGFDEAPFEAQLQGTIGSGTYGPFALEGSVSFDGKAFGTILSPRIEGRMRGRDVKIDGHAIQELDVEGSWLDDDLDLRRITLRSDAADVRGSIAARLAPIDIRASDLTFDVRNLATVRSWIPDAALPELEGSLRGSARLQGTADELVGQVAVSASALRVDGHEIGALALSATAQGRDVEITAFRAHGDWGDVRGAGSILRGKETARIAELSGHVKGHPIRLRKEALLVYPSGSIGLIGLDAEALGGTVRGSVHSRQDLDVDLTFENVVLDALERDGLSGRASGRLQLNEQDERLRLAVKSYRLNGNAVDIETEARQSEDGLDVKSLTVTSPSLRVQGAGRLPFRVTADGLQKHDIDGAKFTCELWTDDLSRWIADAPIGEAQLVAWTEEDDTVHAKLHLQQLRVTPGVDPVANVHAQAVLGTESTRFEGRVEDNGRLTASFDATSTFVWRWREPTLPETKGTAIDGRLKATLHDANAILALLPESAVQARGKMHGNLTAKGPLDALTLGGTVTSEDVQVRLFGVANFVDLTKLEAYLDGDKLRVTDVGIAYQLGSVADTPEPNTRPRVAPEDELDIPEMRYVREALTAMQDMTGTIRGEVEIRGAPDKTRLYGSLKGSDLQLPVPAYGTSGRSEAVEIRFEGKRAIAQPFRIEAGEGNADVDGWIELPLGDDERALADMPMELNVKANAPDIRALGRIVPALKGVAGRAVGHVTLSHSIRSPALTGEMTATDIEMPVPGWKLPVRIPTVKASANDDQVRIEGAEVLWGKVKATVDATLVPPKRWLDDWANQELDARVALDVADLSLLEEVGSDFKRINGRITGNVRAFGPLFRPRLDGAIELQNIRGALPGALPSVDQLSGRIALQDRVIRLTNVRGQLGHAPFTITGSAQLPETGTPSVDLRMQGQNLRLVQTRDMRLRSDMDLRITGPVGGLQATGTVRIQDLVYVASMDLLGGGPETAGEGLDLFSFPWEPLASTKLDVRVQADDTIRIRTNVLRGNLSADVRYVGTGRAPIPRGRAYANDFLVKLPFSSLKVDRGEVRFTEDSPNNPTVDVTARTEMRGYDLTVRALGQLPDVELRTASVPPLRENETILLLTTGATSEELRNEGLARAALTRIGSVFGQSLLSGGRGPTDPDERGFFDRFTFRQGRRVSRTGQETLEAEFEMSDRLYLRVEQDRYDDFNAGFVWRWRFR